MMITISSLKIYLTPTRWQLPPEVLLRCKTFSTAVSGSEAAVPAFHLRERCPLSLALA